MAKKTVFVRALINKNLTITGNGAGRTIIQAAASAGTADHRVFIIVGDKTVTLENITVRHGKTGGAGGGIWNNDGHLTLNSVAVTDNSGEGGGIYNSNNFPGSLNVNNSTISGNHSTNNGGGVYSLQGADFFNTTISGNTSDYNGGGLFISTSGTTTVKNCTISGNHCKNNDSGDYYGGGIYFSGSGGLSISNSLLCNNFRGSGTDLPDDYYYASSGTLTDNGYNVVEYS